jgi:hypothetical protein
MSGFCANADDGNVGKLMRIYLFLFNFLCGQIVVPSFHRNPNGEVPFFRLKRCVLNGK